MNDGLRLGPEPRDELLEAGHEACFPVAPAGVVTQLSSARHRSGAAKLTRQRG